MFTGPSRPPSPAFSSREGSAVVLPRLQQRTTPDAVADTLREAILDGSLLPGRQLRETGIAAELGISRAPLREALRRLEEEGLIVKIPFRGAFVAEVSQQFIDDVARLRSVLEPWAIEQGLLALQNERLPDLQRTVDKLAVAARKGNAQDSVAAHLAFHRTLYEAVGNEALTSLWRGWENQLRLFLAADYREYDDPMTTHHEHKVMLDMIVQGDMRAIRRLLSTHIHGGHFDKVTRSTTTAGRNGSGRRPAVSRRSAVDRASSQRTPRSASS